MRVRRLHPFDLSPREAVELQRRWAPRVRRRGAAPRRLRLVVGVDCAPSRDGRLFAAAVACRAPGWEVLEEAVVAGRPLLPYVPGLLSFREAPLMLEALGRIRTDPDAVLVDGHGVAHPRGLGIAAHVGLHLEVPAVGVAKTRFVGEHARLGRREGATVPLLEGRRQIGTVVRTRTDVKPLIVSVGHQIGLRSAVRVVLATRAGYRLPEPVRQADLASRRAARAARPRRAGPRGHR